MAISSSINDDISKAKNGDPKAIAKLLNIALQPQRVVTRASSINNRLTIFAEGQSLPVQNSLIGVIEKGFKDLGIVSVASVKVYGKSKQQPEKAWSEEIYFSNAQNNGAGKAHKQKTGLALDSIKTVIFQLWKKLRLLVRRLLADRRFVFGSAGLAVVGVLTAGSISGFRFVQARSAYAQKIREAQSIIDSAVPSADDTVEQLEAKLTQMKQARQLLRSIPESQTDTHQSAQIELQKITQTIEKIETGISDVELISDKLSAAEKVVQNALAKVNQPPYAIHDWNAAKREITRGVGMAETIPQYGAMASKVEARLQVYREKLVWVNQAIKNEQKGVDELAKANQIALAAYNLTNGRNKFTVEDLEAARDKWQEAIDKVKTVPATTNAYRSVSDKVDTYTKNKNEVIDGLYDLNTCSYRNSSSESLRSICSSVYMYLTKPKL